MIGWDKFKRATYFVCLLAACSLSPAAADQVIYRCVVNSAITYKDEPCDSPRRPGVEGTGASTSSNATGQAGRPAKSIELDYSTPYGTWRGQAQYQATVNGQPVQEAHVVVPLVIDVEKQGKVKGVSPENGCKLLGIAAPMSANLLTLDVTLSECGVPALNRRYSGTLALYQTTNSVQFSLQSFNHGLAAVTKGAARFDVKATMKR